MYLSRDYTRGGVRGASKYRNRKTIVEGREFASKAEATRYGELRVLERAGVIESLEMQPKFPLEVNGSHVCTYIADFRYRDKETGEMVVEDVKSRHTRKLPVYRIKKKLMHACCGIEITEVVR